MFDFLLNGFFKKEKVSTHEELRRARDAQLLLENPLFVESFEVLKSSLLHEWQNTKSLEKKKRESLWLMLKLLESLKGNFETLVESGKIAERSL